MCVVQVNRMLNVHVCVDVGVCVYVCVCDIEYQMSHVFVHIKWTCGVGLLSGEK